MKLLEHKSLFTAPRLSAKGLTLVEILIVIGIIFILTAFTYRVFYALNERHLLDGDVQAVAEALSSARQRTLSGQNDSVHGVHFTSGEVTVFQGSTYAAGSPQNEAINLSGRTTLSYTLNGGDNVVFERLTGATQNTGTITITTHRSALSETLTVYGTGIVAKN